MWLLKPKSTKSLSFWIAFQKGESLVEEEEYLAKETSFLFS
jgi:hypothetical protein